MEYDASLLREFSIEARDHLESVEDALLKLAIQKHDPDRELIDRVFRSVHSIKGGAGFLSLKQMAKLSHAMEALLSDVRSGTSQITNESTDNLIAGVDMLQLMLDDPERSNDIDISDLLMRFSETSESEADSECRMLYATLTPPDETAFGIRPETLSHLPVSHEFLYLMRYDLRKIWEAEKRSPVQLIKELASLGIIADARMETGIGNLSEPVYPTLTVLYSTILDPEIIGFAAGLPNQQIVRINKDKFAVQEPIIIDLDTKPVPEQFISESTELLDRLGQCLTGLYENPEQEQEAFELIHTFKANSGLMGFADFERVSHLMETVLKNFRSGASAKSDARKQHLLLAADALRNGLNRLAQNGISEIPECDRIIAMLTQATLPKADREHHDSDNIRDHETGAKQKLMQNDIRVSVDKLDMLVNLVGELVIAESLVSRNPESESAVNHKRRIISELQDVALSMRMIPLSRTFRKMFRLVHDLSVKSGKKIKLTLIGEDTEVDKTVIEHITDPLVHIIRNCADHGIESAQDRIKKGKSETGEIVIRAGHEGGEVVISVSDDGAGLNRKKILQKAYTTGIIGTDGSDMPDEAVMQLIFEPGFSTAEKVTDVSGRGVGMDVVRRNLEKLKGRIDTESAPDKGTTITFRLPITLAIIEGMLIRVGTSEYTLPLLSVRESFRPVKEQIIHTPDNTELVRIRNDILPVIRLHTRFGITPEQTELHKGIMIRVASGTKHLCLFADEILGHYHTVIRGIPEYISTAKGISGFTILDNGEISAILDIGSMIETVQSAKCKVLSVKSHNT